MYELILFHIQTSFFAAVDNTERVDTVFRQLNKQFSTTQADGNQFGQIMVLFAVSAALIGVIWGCYHFFGKSSLEQRFDEPWQLYRKLCKAHHLSYAERLVIRKIVRILELEDPLPLFIEPRYFEDALGTPSLESYRPMIFKIYNKLFGHVDVEKNLHEQEYETEIGERPRETDSVLPFEAMRMKKLEQNYILHESHQNETPISPTIRDLNSGVVIAKADPESTVEIENESSADENPSLRKKVLHKTIPGSKAFSALAVNIDQISSEIASQTIQHSLTIKNDMNQRTYDVMTNLEAGRLQTPAAFPKANVPPSAELFQQEENRKKQNSPTPVFLRQKPKHLSPPGRILSTKENTSQRKSISQGQSQQNFVMRDAELLETMVKKQHNIQ